MKTKKLPTREEALKFLESAIVKKLEVPGEARKLLTKTIKKLEKRGLLNKNEADSYFYLTKKNLKN